MSAVPFQLAARSDKKLIGMVHLGASPGTPSASKSPDRIVEEALSEARVLAQAGFDAIILENMHDTPYVHGSDLGPEVVALMARTVAQVTDDLDIPVGVQILSGGNREALAAALVSGGSFIRCENFAFAHVADEGLLAKAEAGPLLRYRRSIGADHIPVFCDIKKKHASHAITGDLSLAEIAEGGAFFGADGFIVTGSTTGSPTSPEDVRSVRDACDLPVIVGSGVTPDSAGALLEFADALIVGSFVKRDGDWKNQVDPERAEAMRSAVR